MTSAVMSACLKYPIITLGPEHNISPSSAIFTLTFSKILPTVPIRIKSDDGALAEITGDV